MSGWKRTAAALLAAVLFAVQTALPSFAQENPAQTEETEILAGELTVYTQSKGVHKADAVLFNHEEILAAPHTIASLTGAELTSGDAGELIFRRGSYVVQISPDGAAEIGLIFQETNAVYLYGKESFTLEGMRTCRDYLTELGYDVFYEEVEGYGHEWDFWDLTLRKAIKDWLPIRHSAIYPDEA